MNTCTSTLLLLLLPSTCCFGAGEQYIVGNVRVQIYSDMLIRLEQKGSKGFENRNTFTVVNRPVFHTTTKTTLKTKRFIVDISGDGSTLNGTRILLPNGKEVYRCEDKLPKMGYFPHPGKMPPVFAFADSPRLIPPYWGATPPPNILDPSLASTSGWDTQNDAPDIYVFVTNGRTYDELRREFLRLTGPTPIPPLSAFGFWDSRYHPYTEQEALDSIDTYRQKHIPLDMFVVDTDWRVNGSHGYAIETKYFPDMGRFLREAHRRNVGVMFNDHPDPQTPTALDPAELNYRWEGLTSLLKLGADVWWYDRNWTTSLHEPMPSIRKEVWGQRIYHDVTERFFGSARRPLIMTNVDGIDNGFLRHPPLPASHRYPIWWTGDTGAMWSYLRQAIANCVNGGVNSLLPYVHDDLGGHWSTPSPELYVRYLQFGCLCPITRVHCTLGEDRHPWAFGPEAERIVSDYIRLRYRLLPTLYSAARKCFEDGTPLLQRCDLQWPDYPAASASNQYLLGDDLLVAPIESSAGDEGQVIPNNLLHAASGQLGLTGEYFANEGIVGEPVVRRTDPTVDFNWGLGAPGAQLPKDHFSARWTGTLGPVPRSGNYTLTTVSDDGSRLWIDGKLVVDQWKPQAYVPHSATVRLQAGKSYTLKLEMFEIAGEAACTLKWTPPAIKKRLASRKVWLPPGEWVDAWTEARLRGPREISVNSPLAYMPLYVRSGGLVITAPNMEFTSQKPWAHLFIDAYVPSGTIQTSRMLYEDDGRSQAYLNGDFHKTYVSLNKSGRSFALNIEPTSHSSRSSVRNRRWTIRLHAPQGTHLSHLAMDGKSIADGSFGEVGLPEKALPFENNGWSGKNGNVLEIALPGRVVSQRIRLSGRIGTTRPSRKAYPRRNKR